MKSNITPMVCVSVTLGEETAYVCPVEKFRIEDVFVVNDDEDLKEKLIIRFVRMTQFELEALPEFYGF